MHRVRSTVPNWKCWLHIWLMWNKPCTSCLFEKVYEFYAAIRRSHKPPLHCFRPTVNTTLVIIIDKFNPFAKRFPISQKPFFSVAPRVMTMKLSRVQPNHIVVMFTTRARNIHIRWHYGRPSQWKRFQVGKKKVNQRHILSNCWSNCVVS